MLWLILALGCADKSAPTLPPADGATYDDTGGAGGATDGGTDTDPTSGTSGDTAPGTGGDTDPGGPGVILMIGDGMGPGQLEAASLYAHGEAGRLFLQSLEHRAAVRTGSLSGITDSAAAATAMATGHKVQNERIGVDREGQPAETVIELAKSLGMATAVVTTASVTHATPAAFTAHDSSRNNYTAIAEDQALEVRPDVLLGGGARYYLGADEDGSYRDDDGLIGPLEDAGCRVLRTADELASDPREAGACVFGLFADNHLSFAEERPEDSAEPTLTELSLAAWEIVSQDPDGFLLVIEGARIDMASHSNDLANTVGDMLAFDEAIRAVSEQIAGRDDVTLIVTADHECGGLEVTGPGPAGTLPEVSWRWGEHTGADIDLYAEGPGAESLAGREIDHTDLHALLVSLLTGAEVVPPPLVLTPDGDTADQRWRVATQALTTSFGEGYNQLDALTLDADAWGLALGLEGVFEWGRNAVVVLLDVDYGAGTGYAGLRGALADSKGRIDDILRLLPLDAPAAAGFGADVAFVTWGGSDIWLDILVDEGGLRGLTGDYGASADDLAWLSAAGVFGQGVRAGVSAVSPVPGEGLEIYLPWEQLYPELGGAVPAGAAVAVAAVLVNDSGELLSNQALPPFASDPGGAAALPGVAVFTVDSNGDGTGDGDAAPFLIP